MKTYKNLFTEKGFTFNEKQYYSNSHIMNYYNLVQDILDGVHGALPKPSILTKMFMSTVYTEYEQMPRSVKERNLYKKLGDIYVLTNKDIDGINSSVKRISKYMGKNTNLV